MATSPSQSGPPCSQRVIEMVVDVAPSSAPSSAMSNPEQHDAALAVDGKLGMLEQQRLLGAARGRRGVPEPDVFQRYQVSVDLAAIQELEREF